MKIKYAIVLAFIMQVSLLFGQENSNKEESAKSTAEKKAVTDKAKENLSETKQAEPAAPQAKSGDSESKKTAQEFLKKLESKNAEIKTLKGEFTQIKKQSLFLEDDIKSEGEFFFSKPGKFRCDFKKPNEMMNLLVDDTAYIYVPENKQVDQYTFNREGSEIKQLNQMLLGFGVSLADIEKVFDYDSDKTLSGGENKIVIILQPKKKDQSIGISRIQIWFDTKEFKPLKYESYENNGDETIIEIKKININENIPEKIFKPEFPKDVEIFKQN